jgi:hypothetical protein
MRCFTARLITRVAAVTRAPARRLPATFCYDSGPACRDNRPRCRRHVRALLAGGTHSPSQRPVAAVPWMKCGKPRVNRPGESGDSGGCPVPPQTEAYGARPGAQTIMVGERKGLDALPWSGRKTLTAHRSRPIEYVLKYRTSVLLVSSSFE